MSKQVLGFANKLVTTAEMLRLSAIKRRGQKAVGKRARLALNEIKKEISNIKRKILENENE